MPDESDPNGADSALAQLGVEIWRLGVRLNSGKADRLSDSYARLIRAFQEAGGAVEDRQGERFVDGMTVEILNQPMGIDPGGGQLVWAETVRPGVYINNRCVIVPQVMLELTEESQTDGTTTAHD